MAFEATKMEIDLILARIADQPEDLQELEMRLREKLGEMRAFGMPLPADLVDLEAALDEKLTADEVERARRDEA